MYNDGLGQKFSCESHSLLSSRINIFTMTLWTKKGCVLCANVYYLRPNMVHNILYTTTTNVVKPMSWFHTISIHV